MAVKTITNNSAVNTENVNRAEQKSFRNSSIRGGNKESSVIPGADFTKNYSITLEDIDRSIINHIKQVLSPKISEAGEMIKVPVIYGNEERWASMKKRGVIRDANGAIILPIIMLRRTSVSKNTNTQQSFKHDVKNELITIVRNSKWSKHNRYDNFAAQTGLNPSIENNVTGPPDFVDINYELIIWTSYMTQMNSLIEVFVEANDTYWGSSTDRKWLCEISEFSDASEIDISGERAIKTTFSPVFKGKLLSEIVSSVVTNKKFQINKTFKDPRRVVFGLEVEL